MTSVRLLSRHLSGHARLSAALAAAAPVYHRQNIPFPYILLAVVAAAGGVTAYLTWRGQQRRGIKPDRHHHEEPR
jgi:hypothetical protein